MAVTPPFKKSSLIPDKDYENIANWELDNAGTMERLIDQGDRYDGIIEGTQNAVDSPKDPYNDENRIDITIPCIGDHEYGKLVMRITDYGATPLKQYGSFYNFTRAKKSISLKGEFDIGQNGQGMAQYQKISRIQRITVRTRTMMYRSWISPSLDPKYRIAFVGYEEQNILDVGNVQDWGLEHEGTMVEWFEPYEGTTDLDPNKAMKIVKEIFGWRLAECPNTSIYINGNGVELPDYLIGSEIRFLGRLGKRMITRNNIPKIVNPEIRGFLKVDRKKGRGMIVVHAKGYKITEIHSGLPKFGTLYINCNELAPVVTANRKGFNDDAFIEALKSHCRVLMKDLPDIKDDTKDSERKEYNSLKEILSRTLLPYMERFAKHMPIESMKRKKEIMLIDPNAKDAAGYPLYPKNPKPTVTEICKLCGHEKIKSDAMRDNCKCKCHKKKKQNEHTSKVGIDNGTVSGKVERRDEKDTNKGFYQNLVDTGPFMELIKEIPCININKMDKLYKFCIKGIPHRLQAERLAPYIAEIVTQLENPEAYLELPYEEYIGLQHKYTIEILESLGEKL